MAPRLPPIRRREQQALEGVDAKLGANSAAGAKVAASLSSVQSLVADLQRRIAKRRIALGLKAKERFQQAEIEQRHACATKLQAFWRTFLVARTAGKLMQRGPADEVTLVRERVQLTAHLKTLTVLCHNLVYTPEQKLDKASTLGRWWRGVLAERTRRLASMGEGIADALETWTVAAGKIQTMFRRVQAFHFVQALRAARKAEEAQRLHELHVKREAATRVILRHGIGMLGRRKAHERREVLRSMGAKKDANGSWVIPANRGKAFGEEGRLKVQKVRDVTMMGDARLDFVEDKRKGGRPARRGNSKEALEGAAPKKSPRSKSSSRRRKEEDKRKVAGKVRVVEKDINYMLRAQEQAASLFSADMTAGMCELLRAALAPRDAEPGLADDAYRANPDYEEVGRTLFTVRF